MFKTKSLDIYTDGSKVTNANYVGSACYVPQLKIEICKSIDNNASIYTAECIAIELAMNVALQHYDQDIFIFSDSLSVLQTLNNIEVSTTTNRYIFNIRKKYEIFLKKHPNSKIQFFWLPSHRGIEGNEMADTLAKNGTKKNYPNFSKIPFTDFYEKIQKLTYASTERQLTSQGQIKGKKYFNMSYNKSRKPWFHNKKLKRETIVTINRIRADHYNLAESLAKINVVNSPLCNCNKEVQNINHILWQCILFDKQREKLVKSLNKLKFQLPLCTDMLVSKPHIRSCELICKFLKECKLQI